MKFKHLRISAIALGLVVGGGATISAFASANSEENPKETLSILKSNADKLPTGTVYKDEVKGETNAGAEYFEFNGTDELPEGVIRMDEVQLGETDSATEYYEFNGTDELPPGTVYKNEMKGNEQK